MSSATPQNYSAAMQGLSLVFDTFGNAANESPEADRLPPDREIEQERRDELQRRWVWYRCQQYEGRSVQWDGGKVLDQADEAQIFATGNMPAGYWVSGGFQQGDDEDAVPARYRKPSAPVHLGKSIINRFTGLLFGANHHPQVSCPGDELTENWLLGFIKDTRFWARMNTVRRFGGAMGSCAVGFKFVNGIPHVEVHDPRMAYPHFVDRDTNTLKAIDKRYIYEDVLDNGIEPVRAWFYYRRVITDKYDITWPRVLADESVEIDWDKEAHTTIEHGFGFCPVVWVQNIENTEDVDGDSDLHGIYDILERIDAHYSQVDISAFANADPTLVITTSANLPPGLRKGSSNAIQLPDGGSAQYLELQGTSIKVELEVIRELRAEALAVARCILESGDAAVAKTATEIERKYSEMFDQVDILREQYGETCVKTLLEMVLKAVRVLESKGMAVKLRPDKGVPRRLGPSEFIELAWPPHVEPGLDDAKLAVDTAAAAKNASIISTNAATKFIAPYLNIEDADQAASEAEKEADEMENATVGSILGETEDPYPPEEDETNFGDEEPLPFGDEAA